ncbi:MAG TPA: T9SS type A sorting domain-containing protein [Puia sp.]|nr:T9SS type A sorting domain-containing protein [Puia sp.]
MPKPIQLHIPAPCHEDWGKMQPAERGRHCAACQKTVVDFTGMSDGEIIRYITRAGSSVCGRLLPDQMNRRLVPMSPVQRNGGKGWQLLLAGLMLAADGNMPQRMTIKGDIALQTPPPPKMETVLMGVVAPPGGVVDTPVEIVEIDSPGVTMGDIGITSDTIAQVDAPPLDSTALQANVPCKKEDDLDYGYTGGITVSHPAAVDTIQQIVKDTVKRAIGDTLTALRILPKAELHTYPNPVQRGGVFYLSWKSEPGAYRVDLLSINGAMVQTRVVQVGSRAQVDTWEIPGRLAAGTYIIQVTRPGKPGGFTQKVMVE